MWEECNKLSKWNCIDWISLQDAAKPVVDYINYLKFDYIDTYSLQPKSKYEENLKADELKEWTITNLAQSRIIKY